MTIKLSNAKAEEIFFDALCNGLGQLGMYGLLLDVNENQYRDARSQMEHFEAICFEDVLIKMLKLGYPLSFKDDECDGEYDANITLWDVHERVPTAPSYLLDAMLTGEDDACTADGILQWVMYNEIIFG
jgi:hypothetical protein